MLPSYWALKAMVLPSGEKTGFDLDADVAGEAADVLAVEIGDPQIVGVDEGDVVRADSGHRDQSGVRGVRSFGSDSACGRDKYPDRGHERKRERAVHDDRWVGGNGIRSGRGHDTRQANEWKCVAGESDSAPLSYGRPWVIR